MFHLPEKVQNSRVPEETFSYTQLGIRIQMPLLFEALQKARQFEAA